MATYDNNIHTGNCCVKVVLDQTKKLDKENPTPCTSREQDVVQSALDGLVNSGRRLHVRSGQDERELNYCSYCKKIIPYSCCSACDAFPCGQCYISYCNGRRLAEEEFDEDVARRMITEQEEEDRDLQVTSQNEGRCIQKWAKVKADLKAAMALLPLSQECRNFTFKDAAVEYLYSEA